MGYCDKCSVGKHFILADTLYKIVNYLLNSYQFPESLQMPLVQRLKALFPTALIIVLLEYI